VTAKRSTTVADRNVHRLYCYELAKSLSQYQLTKNPLADAEMFHEWIEAQSNKTQAFACLQSAGRCRVGNAAPVQVLTVAKEAYSFSTGIQPDSSAEKPPNTTRAARKGPRQTVRQSLGAESDSA
jgi:uncharacterized ParB-like nuclease family protein